MESFLWAASVFLNQLRIGCDYSNHYAINHYNYFLLE